ncbi:MAG: hypothetical protein JWP03_3131 [Phycisphaerales bacterium]|nr:hypothetical protein [Phycisphaerales bacterium]
MPFVPTILCLIYWRAPHLWPVAALAAVVMVVAVVRYYPSQLKSVSWPWRGLLPLLRALAVLALAASLLKPVAVRPVSSEERGTLVVLVDRSRSMSIIDNARTPAQLVALADALGKLPANVRGDALTTLAAGVGRMRVLAAEVKGAQDDLDYARISGREVESRQARLRQAVDRYAQAAAALIERAPAGPEAADLRQRLTELAQAPAPDARDAWRGQIPQKIALASAAITQFQSTSDDRLYQSNPEVRKACDAAAGLSRFALAEQALLRPGGLLARAQRDIGVEAFGIADDVVELALMHDGQPAVTLDSTPSGPGSDLTAGIARAVAGRPVRAVVLFSDGRQSGGDPTVVSGLTPNGVPVFTVSAAAPAPPRDLSFADVQVPDSVYAGQSVAIKATLRHQGFDGAKVEVHCKVGDLPEQVHAITLHDGQPATADFVAKTAAPGVQRVALSFAKAEGEASADNNHAERRVKVVPERMKVLLVAGSPTWDFRYVRNALARSSEFRVRDIILDPNNPKLPLRGHDITGEDVVVLFDVPVRALDGEQWEQVDRVAAVMGGSVVVVSGDARALADYPLQAKAFALLPYTLRYKPASRVWPGEEPAFHFIPAARADGLDALRFTGEGDADAAPRRWGQLPGFFRFLQLPDPHDLNNWNPAAKPLLLEEESRLPVLTEMRKNAGRVFFLGLDETWRWRYKIGERDQDHFWLQLISYASESPYFAHAGPLALDADKVAALPGELVRVRARVTDDAAGAAASHELAVIHDKRVILTRPWASAGPEGSGRYATTVSLPAGDYTLQWSLPAMGGQPAHAVQMPLHVAATDEAEMANLAGDEAMLHKLADASGGEFFTLDQVNRLPERLAAVANSRSRYAELSLWDSPYLFLLVVGCLAAEWALRKRVGLA